MLEMKWRVRRRRRLPDQRVAATDYLLSGFGMGVMIKILMETANNTAM